MKKLFVIVVMSFMFHPGMIWADVGNATIHITGNIKAGTCKPLDTEVDFKDIDRSSFSGDGSIGATQKFTLKLTDCSSDITKINMSATGSADKNHPEAFSTTKEDGTLDNLAVTITHDDKTINPDGTTEVVLQPTDGNVSETFTASLLQDSDVLPALGKFSSVVTVSFDYP